MRKWSSSKFCILLPLILVLAPCARTKNINNIAELKATPVTLSLTQATVFSFAGLTVTVPAGTFASEPNLTGDIDNDSLSSMQAYQMSSNPVRIYTTLDNNPVTRSFTQKAFQFAFQTTSISEVKTDFLILVVSWRADGSKESYYLDSNDFVLDKTVTGMTILKFNLYETNASFGVYEKLQADQVSEQGFADQPDEKIGEPTNVQVTKNADNTYKIDWKKSLSTTNNFVLTYQEGTTAPAHCSLGRTKTVQETTENVSLTISEFDTTKNYAIRICGASSRSEPLYTPGVTTEVINDTSSTSGSTDSNNTSGGNTTSTTQKWTYFDGSSTVSARYSHCTAWTGTEMLIYGGIGSNNDYLGEGGRYNVESNTWSSMSTSPIEGRYNHVCVWTGENNHLFIWGGLNSNGFKNDGIMYNPSTDTWHTINGTNAPTSGIMGVAAVWSGSEVWLFGGRKSNGLYSDELYSYEPNAGEWKNQTSTGAPSARGFAVAVWANTKLFIWGGRNTTGFLSDGGSVEKDATSWETYSVSTTPAARIYHTMIATGDSAIMWGGGTSSSTITTSVDIETQFNDGYSYDYASSDWKQVETESAPDARMGHSMVAANIGMLIWGGHSGKLTGTKTIYSTGSVLKPDGDNGVWEAIPNPPSTIKARTLHTAIWTGSKMVVFGGLSSDGALGDGGIYYP